MNRIEYLNNNSRANTRHRVWEHYYFLNAAGCVIRGWLEWGVELSAAAREGANARYIYERNRSRVIIPIREWRK